MTHNDKISITVSKTEYQDAFSSVESTGQQRPSMHWEACRWGPSVLHWSDGVNMIHAGLVPLVHQDPAGAAHTQKHKHAAVYQNLVCANWHQNESGQNKTHSWLHCTPTHSRPMSPVEAFLPTASSTCTHTHTHRQVKSSPGCCSQHNLKNALSSTDCSLKHERKTAGEKQSRLIGHGWRTVSKSSCLVWPSLETMVTRRLPLETCCGVVAEAPNVSNTKLNRTEHIMWNSS